MAQKSRSAIVTEIPTVLPSGTGDIQALNHRGLEVDIADSHFNLITDYAQDIRLNSTGSTTVREGINSLQDQINDLGVFPVLAAGRTLQFTFGSLSPGQVIGGNGFSSASVSGKTGDEAMITFNMSSVGTSEYVPLPVWVGGSGTWNTNNAIFVSGRSLNSTSFQIVMQRVYDNPTGAIRFVLIKI